MRQLLKSSTYYLRFLTKFLKSMNVSYVKYIRIKISQNFTGWYNASLKRIQFDYL